MANLTIQELIDQRLRFRLNLLNSVKCWGHPGRHTSDTLVDFPYHNWNATPAPLFRKNGAIFTPDSVDSDNGVITYANKTYGDDITCDYSFKYFTDEQLASYYSDALDAWNNKAPATHFDYASYPDYLGDWLTSKAYVYALQTLLVDLTMWEANLIFKNPEALSSLLLSFLSSTEASMNSVLKPRTISAHVIAMGRWKVPSYVSESTWQQYTVIRT